MNGYFYSLAAPLQDMPADGQIRIANLSGFCGLVRNMGGKPLALLEQHQIDPLQLDNPDHLVDCRSVVQLLEHSSDSLRSPFFGLQLARHQDPEIFGCLATLCRAAPTVREGLKGFIDYVSTVYSAEAHLDLVESGRMAEIRWQVSDALGKNLQANFKGTMLSLKLLRMMCPDDLQSLEISLTTDGNKENTADIERQFGARFRRARTTNYIAFSSHHLDAPIASANRLVFNLLTQYLSQLKSAREASARSRVARYIKYNLDSGRCDVQHCARDLGMSVRTLQMKLSAAGTSFSGLHDIQRRKLALALVADAAGTLEGISQRLGYAEASCFARAFKRWTGQSPTQFRRA